MVNEYLQNRSDGGVKTMNELERKEWHESEKDIMVEIGSEDWKLAECYKNQHNPYFSEKIKIAEVWRDYRNFLCVRYITTFGRELDWFHYTVNNGELEWW
jgi:hypothetical protein